MMISVLAQLPTFDEVRAVNRVAVAVALVRDKLGREYGRGWLESTLRRYLREGDLTIAIKAVEAADQGDEIADAALRATGAELQAPLLQRRDLAAGHLQIISYLQRVATRALVA